MTPGGFGGREVGIRCSRIRRALEQMGMSEGAEIGLNSKRRQAVT